MTDKDKIQRFLFEEEDIRGELIGLSDSFKEVIARKNYPPNIALLLGEFLAAAALLAATIKSSGKLMVQAAGDSGISLIMAESSNQYDIRGIAHWDPTIDFSQANLLQLLTHLTITIEPDDGVRYQGIVPLEDDTLAACLEAYFHQSEQIETRVWLGADLKQGIGGLLLQALPGIDLVGSDSWTRVTCLGDTVSTEELLALDNELLLQRLFHKEKVRVFPTETSQFRCSCERTRFLQAVAALGEQEIISMLEETNPIKLVCEFCHEEYQISKEELDPYLLENEITQVQAKLSPGRILH